MATLIAADWDDVQAQHTLASNGDTIEVTAGSYTVTGTTTITKAITLIAGGVVNLTDNTPDASDLLNITESTAGLITLDGFNFLQGTGEHTQPNGVISLDHTASGYPILIVNCTYTMITQSGDFIVARVNQGVIAYNTLTGYVAGANCLNNSSFIRQKCNWDTDGWSTLILYGADDTTGTGALYIETNIINYCSSALDCDDFGRMVIRYNTFFNSSCASHGADTSNPGGRYMEFGWNTWIHDRTGIITCTGGVEQNIGSFIHLRGGTALIHDNVIPDPSAPGVWGPKPAVEFAVQNIRRNAGAYACWSEGYPSPRQPGWGWTGGGTEYGTTGVYGDLEPIYLWNNSGDGNYNDPAISSFTPNECGPSAPEADTFLQAGREWHTNTEKPGYVPFAYPHPLLSGLPPDPDPGPGPDPDPGPTPTPNVDECDTAYTAITLTAALAALGRRLYDPDSVFWTDAEKTIYLQEAIRTFNALSNFYRCSFNLYTVTNSHWYELSSVPDSLRDFNVTDEDLYTRIEYHLLEPPTGATWTGTLQFDIDDLVTAIQIRRDQLLGETGCTLQRMLISTNGSTRNRLDGSVIDIRRVAYLPLDDSPSPMWRDDNWAQQSWARGRGGTPGTPSMYKQSTQPTLSFQTDVPPASPGTYELLTVNSGDPLDPVYPGTLLNIPDDFSWVVEFGAMAELLNRDSLARDPMRATYCEQRYVQGIALLKTASELLSAEMDYEPLDIDAVQMADDYRVSWQAEEAGTPDAVYIAGLNYIALAPKPDSVMPILLTVVQNAPIPTLPGDYLQVGQEDYDAILDYAQHLAAFKQGGAEFTATFPLLQEFIKHCAQYNEKLLTMGEFTDVIYGQSQLQEQADPTSTKSGKDGSD